MTNPLHFHWKDPHYAAGFRTGVSLHSHTLHSRESLDFLRRIASHVPLLERELLAASQRFERAHGQPLVLSRGWWTPPLGPQAALALEGGQISRLGLRPLVSLTDHDNLDAHRGGETIRSVELTIPIPQSFLHLGIHNLPADRAHEVLAYGRHPAALMGWLSSFPQVLVVLNHPLWDEAGIGEAAHRAAVERFLARNQGDIHALELNGLRPWRENRQVMEMAKAWNLPAISGGDRHGIEPNANLNLTNAETFDEFVDEIRNQRTSHVLFLPGYRRPYVARIGCNLLDILQEQPEHPLGWRMWPDRVFYELQPGMIRSLSEFWPGGEPSLTRFVLRVAGFVRASGRLAPIRLASGLLQECRP